MKNVIFDVCDLFHMCVCVNFLWAEALNYCNSYILTTLLVFRIVNLIVFINFNVRISFIYFVVVNYKIATKQ